MIERPNRDVLTDALDKYRDAMRPFIVRALRRVKGKSVEVAIYDTLSTKQASDFEKRLENNGGNIEGAIDIGDFPNLISRNWREVFNQQFDGDVSVQSPLHIITQARNKVSHPDTGDLETEYTRVVLYHIVDVLGKINAPESKVRVEECRDEILGSTESESLIPDFPDDTKYKPQSKSQKLTPWREVIPPNLELTQGTFEESELAANLQQVYDGRASATSYGNPVSFFDQTYITDGMHTLLVNALKRLGSKGGAPVIQMKTGFGGGKTHSLIALYYIANSIDALVNIPSDSDSAKTREDIERIIQEAQWDVSAGIQPKVAVLDGTYLSPTDMDVTKENGDPLNKLWGVMAYQLGGQEAYDLIGEAARRQDTAPLGAQLDRLFDHIGPCVILIDELVAYLLNVGGDALGINYTFIQALTESVRRSPNVVLVATLPTSQSEVGGLNGMDILTTLEARLGRIESIWKPLQTEDAFEVVRRRLFGNKIDEEERDRTCEAFLNMYNQNKKSFPQGVHETRYHERMKACYPIHPEIFERLHTDWSTINEFQRTRGVLRLMANWISRLYRRSDPSPLIMPANLPLDDSVVSSEFEKLLPGRWDVVFTEADSDNGEADKIDKGRNNFAEYGGAARRIARTVFLGSCPGRSLIGIDVNRIHLGVAQPGWHRISTYTEALNEMRSNLYYFYSDDERYYFHTEENLNKVAIDRANELSNHELNEEIVSQIGKAVMTHRSKVIICPADLDAIPDSNDLRLVILPPDKLLPSRSSETDEATPAALHILTRYANKERTYRNTLLFLVAKIDAIRDLKDPIAKHLAWQSITQGERRIENLEGERYKQARASLNKASESIRSLIPRAYRWAIAPAQVNAQRTEFTMSAEQTQILDDGDIVKSAFETFKAREDVIEYETHESLDALLKKYIWDNNAHISIQDLWNMMTQYVYMPRLISKDVLTDAIKEGVQAGTFGYAEYYEAEQENYQGMSFAEPLLALDMKGLLVKPEIARRKPPLSLESLTLVLQKKVWDDGHVRIHVKNVQDMMPAHVDEKQLQEETLIECIQQGVSHGEFGYAAGGTDEQVFFREVLDPDVAILEGMIVAPREASAIKTQEDRGATRIVALRKFEGEPSLDDINSICQEIITPLRADGGDIAVEFTIIAYKEDGFSQNIERSVKTNSAELNVEVKFDNE